MQSVGLTGVPFFVCFIILTMLINFLIGSGSAKVDYSYRQVPMMMLLGYHPAFIQLYRVGDSPTNAIAPLGAYLYMALAVVNEKYDKDMKLGTFIANCIPTTMILQVIWILFTIAWYLIGLPIARAY